MYVKTSDKARSGRPELLWRHLANQCTAVEDAVRAIAKRRVARYAAKRAKGIVDNEPPALSVSESVRHLDWHPLLSTTQAPPIQQPTHLESPTGIESQSTITTEYLDDASPSARRRRTDAYAANHSEVLYCGNNRNNNWESKRDEFNAELCKLLVACNVSWQAVEHPFWRHFFQKWIPGCVTPERKLLSGQVLDEQANKVIDNIRRVVIGRYRSGQSDRWKDISTKLVMGSMVNVEYKPYLIGMTNVSAKAKTPENLLEIVQKDIKYCVDVLGIQLIGWCTYSSGESLKLRKLLVSVNSWMVVVECWAHQIDLVVGDYLKFQTNFVKVINDAVEISKWLNNHSRAFGILRKESSHELPHSENISLIIPATTRWTSYYLTLCRLLKLETTLRHIVLDPQLREDLLACAESAAEAKQKAGEIIDILNSPSLWIDLRIAKRHLEPFAFAANATQRDNARLDVVILTLANLYRVFSNPRFDKTIGQVILNSLERHWIEMDQDIFILVLVLNPYIRVTCFHPKSTFRTMGGLWPIFKNAFYRFFSTYPDIYCRTAFLEYITDVGDWSYESMGLAELSQLIQPGEMSLIDLWREHDTKQENGKNGLVKMAMRILSVVPNCAATERIFSKFGATHTKLKDCLQYRFDRAPDRKMVLLKNDIDRQFPRSSLKRERCVDEMKAGPSSTPAQHTTRNAVLDEISDEEHDTEGDIDPIPPFHILADELINDATSFDADKNQNISGCAELASEETRINYRNLKNLFHYPTETDPSPPSLQIMLDYWKRAESGLQAEASFHEVEAAEHSI